MKGFLLFHGRPKERIHDLGKILVQVVLVDAAFRQFADAPDAPTPYSVTYRYPDEQGVLEPSREEFDEALQYAQEIYDFVLGLLPAEARP